jgi:type II secretory pathway component GspD/PulD (secretin)
VLRPLIPPNNTINVNPGNNSLVITDYADNMRRLARIIAALDVPNASDIEVIPAQALDRHRHAAAGAAAGRRQRLGAHRAPPRRARPMRRSAPRCWPTRAATR